MTTPLTRTLGKFIAELRYEQIPAEALSVIHMGFTDCVGVMIAGRNEPAPQKLKLALAPAPGEASLLFGEASASVPEAAWINGTAAHALDYDDVALRGHPSTVLVPAIPPQAAALCATGRQTVTASAAGYSTWAELVSRVRGTMRRRRFTALPFRRAPSPAVACAVMRSAASVAAVAVARAIVSGMS